MLFLREGIKRYLAGEWLAGQNNLTELLCVGIMDSVAHMGVD